MASAPITGISSMATRLLLAELAAGYAAQSGTRVVFDSVGGVEAIRRLEAGEQVDVAVLAADALDRLIDAGRVLPGSKVDLAYSGVAVAVKSGTPRPDLSSETALLQAVLAAPTVGYSTGPSGVALAKLFERLGIAKTIAPRIVVAPPGVPVGGLIARGVVALGFQQLSELLHVEGIDIVGPLPATVQIITTFSAGLCTATVQPDAARALLKFLASPASAGAKQRQGMDPA